MPSRPTRDTLLRIWEMLNLLPTAGNGLTAAEITQRLEDEGFPISQRQVERDLDELAGPVPIIPSTDRPARWRWMPGSSRNPGNMALPEALSWQLVADIVTPLLPRAMLQGLQPFFEISRKRLDAIRPQNPAAGWRDRVRLVMPTQPLLPPKVKDEVLETIQHAVLHCCQIQVSYRNQGADSASELPLHPLGLIQRGQVAYLLATAYQYQDVRLFALHRMESALLLDRPVVTPEGFDIDEALRQGLGQFGTGHAIRLVARIDKWLALHLQETRLSDGQTLTPLPDGSWRLDAEVLETWQLEWWILSQGAALEVLEPEELRDHIRRTLKKAARQYKRSEIETPITMDIPHQKIPGGES